MKNKLYLIVSFAILLVISSSCEKNNYYIKYEVDINGTGSNITYITVKTENGDMSFQTTSKSFSETFGPINNKFVAKIQAYTEASRGQIVNVRIYASRGKEAFALKKTESQKDPKQKNPVVAEYHIDF